MFPSLYKIFAAFFVWNGILELLPPVLSAPSTGLLTRKVGEDVIFMFNASTNISEVSWGIRDGDTNNIKQGSMIYVDSSGAQLNPNLPSRYAGRVSFIGDLTKGQAWFKIINLNINDTNQYMAKILVRGASGYDNILFNLTVIKPIPTTTVPITTVPTTTSTTAVPTTAKRLLISTTTSTVTPDLPNTQSPKPTTISSKYRSGSNSTCTCTFIIATCIAIIILLVLVVVFLLIYIWRGRASTKKRTTSSISKDEELGVYENAFQVGVTSVDKTTLKSSRMPTADKELYETVNENRPHGEVSPSSGARVSTENVTTSLDPFTNIQGNSPSIPQHYQELTNVSKRQPMPVYEPLNQRSNESKRMSSGDTKTYEQLQQNPQGREYQSLESYPKVESKV